MTQISNNYGLVLLESAILANEIEDTKKVIFEQPMLLEALKSPIVSLAEKEKIIDAVFPEGIRKFLKVVAVHHDFNKIQDIFAAYDKHRRKGDPCNNLLCAKTRYKRNRTDTGNVSETISCPKSNDRMDREKEIDRWLYHTGWRHRNGLEHGRSFAAIRE